MNTFPSAPTSDPLDNDAALAVARRLAYFVGPAIRTSTGTAGGALYLALGAAVAATRDYTADTLIEVFGHLADDELPHWERALGMLSGEGLALAPRRAAVRSRWLAIHRSSAFSDLRETVLAIAPDAVVLPIAAADVRDTDPYAAMRLAILLPDEQEASESIKSQINAALAVQAEAQVDWEIGRGDGSDDIRPFLCDRADRGAVDRDLLAS